MGEAGINHNGEIKKAFEMIELAKKSELNAIKFQTFNADEFIANVSLTHTYFSQGKKITESQYDMFKRCEFSKEEWYQIKEKCDKEKILFLSTPENRTDLDLLLQIGIPAIKIGSDELVNIPLLKDFAKTKLPIILSSGMCTLAEVTKSLNAIGALDDYPTILLVTTSEYPTPDQNVNLLKFENNMITNWSEVCKLGELNGFQTVNIIQPILGTSNKNLNIDDPLESNYLKSIDMERISSASSCDNIVDLRDVFSGIDEKQIYFDRGHMSDLGNEIIAEKLFELISPMLLEK